MNDHERKLRKIRVAELMAWLYRERRRGESMWDTAKRLIVDEMLATCKTKKEAARRMGTTSSNLIHYFKYRRQKERVEARLKKK